LAGVIPRRLDDFFGIAMAKPDSLPGEGGGGLEGWRSLELSIPLGMDTYKYVFSVFKRYLGI
jgi:hypothetical protein